MIDNSVSTNNDVFISYSSKNEDICNYIFDILRNEKGINPWKANANTIVDGADFRQSIMTGIENSKIFLLLLSKESMNSKWVDLEITQAILHNKKIFVLRLDDYQLNELQEFKFGASQITDGTKDLDAKLEALAISIKEEKDQILENKKHLLNIKSNQRRYRDFHWFFLTMIWTSVFMIALSSVFVFGGFSDQGVVEAFNIPFYTFAFLFLFSFISCLVYYARIKNQARLGSTSACYVLYRMNKALPFGKRSAEKYYKKGLSLNDPDCLAVEYNKSDDVKYKTELIDRLKIAIKPEKDMRSIFIFWSCFGTIMLFLIILVFLLPIIMFSLKLW